MPAHVSTHPRHLQHKTVGFTIQCSSRSLSAIWSRCNEDNTHCIKSFSGLSRLKKSRNPIDARSSCSPPPSLHAALRHIRQSFLTGGERETPSGRQGQWRSLQMWPRGTVCAGMKTTPSSPTAAGMSSWERRHAMVS
jgi:hypothetical protein